MKHKVKLSDICEWQKKVRERQQNGEEVYLYYDIPDHHFVVTKYKFEYIHSRVHVAINCGFSNLYSREAGIERRRVQQLIQIGEWEILRAKQFLEDGYSIAEIARIMGITALPVQQMLGQAQ